MNRSERNELVEKNLPLVGFLVSDARSRSSSMPWEDMVSAGSEALVRAADAYDASRGVPFGAFARHRIKGALADALRNNDWAGRTARTRITEFRQVRDRLTATLGREPESVEIAAALGVGENAAEAIRQDASRTLSTLEAADEERLVSMLATPEETVLIRERSQAVAVAVEELPEKMRHIIHEIFYRERPVKDIAEELGITHSAVSQQRSEAIRMIREGLRVHDEAAPASGSPRRAAYLSAVSERTLGGFTRQDLAPEVMAGAA